MCNTACSMPGIVFRWLIGDFSWHVACFINVQSLDMVKHMCVSFKDGVWKVRQIVSSEYTIKIHWLITLITNV